MVQDFDGGNLHLTNLVHLDFRVETDTLTHAFFADGSADKIGLDIITYKCICYNGSSNSTGAIAV